jgi:hypothetical protein
LIGEKNGKEIGKTLSIVQKNAGKKRKGPNLVKK